MARTKWRGRSRAVRPTLLLVGEGLAEFKFLAMVKAIATRDGNGPSVTLRQANGKGALHVVDYAARQWKANNNIDKCAVFLDADTECYYKALAKARGRKIVVMANNPCLEASLLRLDGAQLNFETSNDCKGLFSSRFGGEAHQQGLLEKNFNLSDELLQKFDNVDPLSKLLNLLNYAS